MKFVFICAAGYGVSQAIVQPPPFYHCFVSSQECFTILLKMSCYADNECSAVNTGLPDSSCHAQTHRCCSLTRVFIQGFQFVSGCFCWTCCWATPTGSLARRWGGGVTPTTFSTVTGVLFRWLHATSHLFHMPIAVWCTCQCVVRNGPLTNPGRYPGRIGANCWRNG